MRTEHCLLLNQSRLRARFGASKTGLSPPVKFLLLTIPRRFYCDSLCCMFGMSASVVYA